jgi:transcriptional regulator GlxA family with amidase domain
LLIDTSLSIKEISTAVGYLHQSQLSRHFRDACAVTPHAFRSLRVSSPQSARN